MRATLTALIALMAGCGGGDEDNLFDEPIEVPPGPHHTYVVNRLTLSASSTDAIALGLDIDHKAQDGVDNQLANVFTTVGVLFPQVRQQPLLDAGMATGDPIFLLSLRGPSLDAGPLELHTLAGRDPVPAACSDELDEICGRHLDGGGSFSVTAPRAEVPLTGLREDTTYLGGAGDAVLPIVMGGRTVWLPLTRARVELSVVSADRLSGKLGGAARIEDVNGLLVPAYADAFRAAMAADCGAGGSPPRCGCTPDSAGADIAGLFDKPPTQDCQITDEEVLAVASGIITPDIDLDGDRVNDAVSYGIGIDAVSGQFTP